MMPRPPACARIARRRRRRTTQGMAREKLEEGCSLFARDAAALEAWLQQLWGARQEVEVVVQKEEAARAEEEGEEER